MRTSDHIQRVGVTGHVDVQEETAGILIEALTARLRDVVAPQWHGITCLAQGADQLFATVVLALKGSYDVVLPAEDYQQRMVDAGHAEPFLGLLARASNVTMMPYPTSSPAAYLAASDDMLQRSDLLVAIWDGLPSRNSGDTADIVHRARARQIPVTVVWPDRAGRELTLGLGRAGAGGKPAEPTPI